ncbi:MAG: hypothetical protein ACRD7E_02450, partial [Bryobacteraceae bacterium]
LSLPSGVLGPVDFWALARLAATRGEVVSMWLFPFQFYDTPVSSGFGAYLGMGELKGKELGHENKL